MKRPLYVKQHETHREGWTSTYWYTLERGNGQPMLTSETYFDRSNAVRAAKTTISLLDPSRPVEFWYWAGPMNNTAKLVTRRIR